MKPLFLGLMVTLTPLCLLAQDHQTMKKTLSRHLEEVYDVAKIDWKVKDGRYIVLDDERHQVVRGTYTRGARMGVWTYLNSAGAIVQQYDFSHDSLLYSTTDSSMFRTDYRMLGDVGDSGQYRFPYKIGGSDYGFWLLYDERDIPAVVRSATSVAQMTYVLTISEKGTLEGYTILFSGEGFTDIAIHRSIRGLPHDACEFAAGTLNGHPIRSQISWTVPLDIRHFDHPGTNYFPTQKTSKD